MHTSTTRLVLAAVLLSASTLVGCSGDAYSPGPSSGAGLPGRTTGGGNGSHPGASTAGDPAKDAPAPTATPAPTAGAPTTPTTPTTPTKPPTAAKRACATPTDSVTAAYEIALLRAPDNQGLSYWLLQLQAGQSRLSILESFVRSDEFVAARAMLSDAQFVTSLYNGFLGRAPDAAGLDFWTTSLASGTSRNDAATAFVNGAEFADPAKNPAFACFF